MSRRIIDCDSCGQHKPHWGRGWCHTCWNLWDRAERPAAGPPPRRTGRWEEYLELTREHHYTLENAAARMRISKRTAQRHEARIQAMGIGRSPYESGQYGIHATRPTAFSAHHEMAVA